MQYKYQPMQANKKRKSLNRNVEFGTKKIQFKDVIIVAILIFVIALTILKFIKGLSLKVCKFKN